MAHISGMGSETKLPGSTIFMSTEEPIERYHYCEQDSGDNAIVAETRPTGGAQMK